MMKSKLQEVAQPAKNLEITPQNYFIKAFLAGSSGSGKTLSSSTLPGKILHLDFDGRSETLAGESHVEIIKCLELDHKTPTAWAKAEQIRHQIIAEVKAKVFPYQSIVFDGLTSLGRQSLNWALTLDPGRGLGDSPARQHYLPQMDNLAKYVLSTLALPLNIIYTGHLDIIEEEDTGKILYLPKITGKLRTELPNWFSETYFCFRLYNSKEKQMKYYWQTAGSGSKEFFKSTLNKRNLYWANPVEINFNSPLVGFADLLNRRFGEKQEDKTLSPRKEETIGSEDE